MPGTQKVNYPEQINGTIPVGGGGLGFVGWDEGSFIATGTILNVVGARLMLSVSGTVLNLNSSPDPQELIGIYGLSNGAPLGTGTWLNIGNNLTASISGSVIRIDALSGGVPSAHGCKLSRASGNFNVGNNTLTAVQFTSEEYDTDSMHDNSTNNTQIIIPSISGITTGSWRFTAYGYTDIVSGRIDVQFKKNGTTIIGMALLPASTSVGGYLGTTEANLVATDYVECLVRTTAGNGNVILDTGAGISPAFIASFLGKIT